MQWIIPGQGLLLRYTGWLVEVTQSHKYQPTHHYMGGPGRRVLKMSQTMGQQYNGSSGILIRVNRCQVVLVSPFPPVTGFEVRIFPSHETGAHNLET